MKAALGFKSHSGWAVMMAIGADKDGPEVIDRRRIELIEEGELWAKQPYHAAEGLDPNEARNVVKRGIESAHRVAIRGMSDVISHLAKSSHEITGCAVLVPEPMPDWSTDEILAVHFRMHKAEGVLFPDALCRAAEICGLRLLPIREKRLVEIAEKELSKPAQRNDGNNSGTRTICGPALGKGPEKCDACCDDRV